MQIVADFSLWLEQHPREGAIYRGHADFNWSIQPSAFRDGKFGIVNKRQLWAWRNVAGRFANPIPRNSIEWLVLAQHYGIPTPLLDWTTNPLVALFFACLSSESDGGCVIQYQRSAFLPFNAPETVEPFKDSRITPGLIDATVMNPRTLAQDSVMSIHSQEYSIMHIEPAASDRYIVPHVKKANTLEALKRFGFTYERLFADLATVAREFGRELEISDALRSKKLDLSFLTDDKPGPDLDAVRRTTNLR